MTDDSSNEELACFDFSQVEEICKQDDLTRIELEQQIVEYMNKYFCIIKGTVCTIIETTVDEDDEGNPYHDLIFRSAAGFRQAMANKNVVLTTIQKITTSKKTKTIQEEETVCLYDLWMESKFRLEYDRMAFRLRPGRNTFNLFRGFRIDEQDLDEYDAKDAKPWVDHIKHIWCHDNEELYDYVLDYLAHIVQYPFTKTGVGFVCKSNQGAGKGIILSKIADIFGPYFKSAKMKEFTGSFNGVLVDALVLFLDECVMTGDKKEAAYLKTLITEVKHQINMKNLPPVTLDNRINVFIATNYQWCAPMEERDRRYFVLELDNKYSGRSTKKTHAYFKKISDVPYQAVYKYLSERDISNFVPSIFPSTEAMKEQKIYNLDSVPAWIKFLATDGSIHTYADPDGPYNEEEEVDMPKPEVYRAYRAFCDDTGYKAERYFSFFQLLQKIIPFEKEDTQITIPDREELKEAFNTYMGEELI